MFEAFRSPCINHKWRSKGLEHPCYPPFWVKNCREFDADKGMSATGFWGASGYLQALPNQSDLNI